MSLLECADVSVGKKGGTGSRVLYLGSVFISEKLGDIRDGGGVNEGRRKLCTC